MGDFFCQFKKSLYLCIRKSRGGAVVARWAHNPEVVGSNPAPATKIKSFSILSQKLSFCLCLFTSLRNSGLEPQLRSLVNLWR